MIKADLHCHTLASAHAYSTLYELIAFARKKDIRVLAMTDHGPVLPDSPNIWHFKNLRTIPEICDGVHILKGVEANIVGADGAIDIPDNILDKLDWVIASFHDDAYYCTDEATNTQTWLNIAENPRIDMIGHPDRHPFIFDHERVIKAFYEHGKVVEINNHSFSMTRGSIADIRDIVKICKKYGVMLALNSDAHVCFDIGEAGSSEKMIEEMNYDKNLIVNYSPEMILELVKQKRSNNG